MNFAKLGAETDKATGNKPGGKMSQFLTYVSQATETKSHLDTAKSSASSSVGVIKTQTSEMGKHRAEAYGDSNAVWDGRNKVDPKGPDLEQLLAARFVLEDFLKSADKQMEVINSVTSSLPSPQ